MVMKYQVRVLLNDGPGRFWGYDPRIDRQQPVEAAKPADRT